jgi:hypothetical protein
VRYADGAILLPESGGVRLGHGVWKALDVECKCECLMWDEASGRVTAMGLRSLQHDDGLLIFSAPVDVEYNTIAREGVIYSQGTPRPEDNNGFELSRWLPVGDDGWKTNNSNRASFRKADGTGRKAGHEA